MKQLIKSHLVLITIALLSNRAIAQAPDTLWTRIFGGSDTDIGNCVRQTSDSGYIIVGWTESFGNINGDIYLIKTDCSGDTLWTKTYSGIYSAKGFSVQQTSDIGYIITGSTYVGGGAENVYLIKTDSLGDTLWTRTYSAGTIYNWGYSVQTTADGGYIIVGGAQGSGGFDDQDVLLIKTDSLGNELWIKKYGSSSDAEDGRDVCQTSDKGYIVVGWTTFPGPYTLYVVKIDSLGNVLWERMYTSIGCAAGWSILKNYLGNYIIGGSIVPEDVLLMEIDPSGTMLWKQTYGGIDQDVGYCVVQTSDSGYVISGCYSYYAPEGYVYVVKTNQFGDTVWTKVCDQMPSGRGYYIQQCNDGSYIIVGITLGGTAANIYLIKLDMDFAGIKENEAKETSFLLKPYPNPFNTKITIFYTVPYYSNIMLNIYDLSGRCIRTLLNGEKPVGNYTINLNAKDLSSGIYFVELKAYQKDDRQAKNYKTTKQLILMR